MLKLMPRIDSNKTVAARTTGTVTAAISVTRRLSRNTHRTAAASRMPISMASRTLAAEETIN